MEYYDPDTFHMDLSDEMQIPFYKQNESLAARKNLGSPLTAVGTSGC